MSGKEKLHPKHSRKIKTSTIMMMVEGERLIDGQTSLFLKLMMMECMEEDEERMRVKLRMSHD
jgi:hypothetical protein